MATNLLPFNSDGGFVTAGNITTAVSASPAPSINGFSSVSADNFRLMAGNITGGIATVVDDGINSIALAPGAQMDVFGFPFSQITRGQLTISGVATPSEVNGTWYYQSINTYTYQIYTDSTYSTLVDATGWSAYTGNGTVAITKQVPAANIVINTNGYLSKFNNDGQLNLPGNLLVPNNAYISTTNATGNVVGKTINIQAGAADQTDFYTTAGGNLNLIGGLGAGNDGGGGGVGGSVNISAGLSADPVGNAGNVIINVGDTSYKFSNSDLNVTINPPASPAPSLSGFGLVSVPVITNGTGNITINANSNQWVFDTTGNLVVSGSSGGMIKTVANGAIGITAINGGTDNPAQMMSWTVGQTNPNTIISTYASNALIQSNVNGTIHAWKFDNAGNLTLPANTFAINYANGTQVSLGGSSSNISNGNSNVTIATSAGNVVTNVNGSAILTTYSGGIKVGGSGVLQSPAGASSITLNSNGANIPTANITVALNVTGASGANITANLTAGNISTGGTLTSTGKFGYASGSTVTQTTNRGNGVTINTLAGTIVTVSASMVAGEISVFSVTNNKVDATTDIVLVQVVSPNLGNYNVIANPNSGIGGFYLTLQNISGFSISAEAVTIRFMVIKAPNA